MSQYRMNIETVRELDYWYRRYIQGMTQAAAALEAMAEIGGLPTAIRVALDRIIDSYTMASNARRALAAAMRSIRDYYWIPW